MCYKTRTCVSMCVYIYACSRRWSLRALYFILSTRLYAYSQVEPAEARLQRNAPLHSAVLRADAAALAAVLAEVDDDPNALRSFDWQVLQSSVKYKV